MRIGQNGEDFSEIISSAVKELVTKMNIRLEIAKAREGLACALKEGNNVLPFCRIQLSCKLDVIDKDIYSELQEKLEKKEQSLKTDMLTEAVEFFGSKISTLNNTMKTTLDNTKEIIGTASKGAGDARKELVERFLEMKQNQEKTTLRIQNKYPQQKR